MAHVKHLMKVFINRENMSKIFSSQQRSAGIERKKITVIYSAFYCVVMLVNLNCGVQINILDLSRALIYNFF